MWSTEQKKSIKINGSVCRRVAQKYWACMHQVSIYCINMKNNLKAQFYVLCDLLSEKTKFAL